LYDPVSNATLVAGPTNSGGATWAAGALALPRPDGNALFITGGNGVATTHAYTSQTGTISGIGPVGTFAAGPALPTGCEINGAGSVAIRKQDGKYIILSKINVAAVYDPVANTTSQLKGSCTTPTSGMGPTVALADGAHAIPMQDGRFLIIHGGALTSTTVYDPSTDTFSSGPTITAGGAGRHSVMNPDGTWQLIAGGGTATDNLNTGLKMTGVYESDDISTSNLNQNSTLRWTSQQESAFTGIGTGAGDPSVFTATESASGGSCTAAVHQYQVTYMLGGAEVLAGPVSNAVTCNGTDKVDLTNIPLGPAGTTARKIYRSSTASAGVVKFQLLNTTGACSTAGGNNGITDNTTTSCTDTVADASLSTTLATGSGAVQSGATSPIRFFVRTAVNSSGCSTPLNNAVDREVLSSGDLIRPGSADNCIRITVRFNRALPKRIMDDRGTYTGNGTTTLRFDYATPVIFDVAVDNAIVLRRTGLDFSLPGNSWNNPGTAPAPTALTAGAPSSGGSCTAGTHSYKVTYVMSATTASATAPYTESTPGAVSNFITCTGPNGTVALSSIPTGPSGTTARKIYRTLANDVSDFYLLTTINDNSTTTYNDTSADSSLGAMIAGYDASGPVMTRVEAQSAPNALMLPPGRLTPTTMNGTTGFYQGVFSANQNVLPQITADSTIVMARPNKTYVVISNITSGAAANAALYDPTTGSFVAQSGTSIPTAANGVGGFALKRPDGKFLVVLGNGTTTTNIYDPVSNMFSVGPALTVAAGIGAMAIPNTDGTYTIMHGGSTRTVPVLTTSIYDPVRNTMTAGPNVSASTGVACGALAIPLTGQFSGMYKVLAGQAVGDATGVAGSTATMNYNAQTKTFTAGTALANAAGCGAYAFQRQDGMWVEMGGANGAATVNNYPPSVTASMNIINPDSNTAIAGPATGATTMGRGGFAIPRADGTYLLVYGGGTTTTILYIPWGGTFGVGAGIGTFGSAGPALTTAVGPGGLFFQRPDGKIVIINGGSNVLSSVGTATTSLYDAGWYADGQYLSEQMQVPALSANATLDWSQSADNFVRMEVRAASSQAALSTTGYTSISKPGQSMMNAGGETWVQVEVNMRREFPTFGGTQDGVYNSTAGMTYLKRTIPVPTLYNYQINNGQDLMTLQTNGSNVLRVTSGGNIYSSSMGGFFSGGADLAENYTSDDALLPGEIVAVDDTDVHNVKRATRSYQEDLLGVVSTAPGFVAGAYTEGSYPIALVGRVPVKVTTENGVILAGQRITSASLAGYGMKAISAGRVIGVALESMDESTLSDCPEVDGMANPYRCGEIMVFVNLADFNGASVGSLVAALSGEDTAADTAALGLSAHPMFSEYATSLQMLGFLKQVGDPDSQVKMNMNSEIFAKDINASERIVSPLVVADTIVAKHIKADTIEGLEIYTDKIGSLEEKYAALSDASAQSSPADMQAMTAYFTGMMKNIMIETLVVKFDSSLLGKLTVGGNARFDGEAVFGKAVSFLDETRFGGQVTFDAAPTFGSDTGGFAVIAEGQKSVTIVFDTAYAKQPIISVSLTNDVSPLADDAKKDPVLAKDIEAVEQDAAEAYFESDIRYIVTRKSERGFTILLNKKAPRELEFSWVALSVKGGKTFRSEVTEEETSDSQIDLSLPIETTDLSGGRTDEDVISASDELSTGSVTQDTPMESPTMKEDVSLSQGETAIPAE
jgi:hypothetical protein